MFNILAGVGFPAIFVATVFNLSHHENRPPPTVVHREEMVWAAQEIEFEMIEIPAPPKVIPEWAIKAQVTPTPKPQPTVVRTVVPSVRVVMPEPLVRANRNAIYDLIAQYFPEQPDKAYRVSACESGFGGAPQPATNTGNGYYGMWQFDLPTWRSVGGTGLPSNASAQEQVMRARMLYDKRGWQPWSCK